MCDVQTRYVRVRYDCRITEAGLFSVLIIDITNVKVTISHFSWHQTNSTANTYLDVQAQGLGVHKDVANIACIIFEPRI